MTKLVEVVVKATKKKQYIPAAWLDHPVLGRPFEKTPRQRGAEKKASSADTTKNPASPDKKED
ncbi:MAG: hypothetical protein ACTHXF_08965 [Brevibacterium yomogidense]